MLSFSRRLVCAAPEQVVGWCGDCRVLLFRWPGASAPAAGGVGGGGGGGESVSVSASVGPLRPPHHPQPTRFNDNQLTSIAEAGAAHEAADVAEPPFGPAVCRHGSS